MPKEFDEDTLRKFIDEQADKRFKELMKDAQTAHGDTQANRHEHDHDPSASAGTPPPKTEPAATPPHVMRSWEKTCPNCSLGNPEHKEPDLECPTCHYPMGNLPADFKPLAAGEKRDVPEIKPCARCGNTEASFDTFEKRAKGVKH